MIEIVSFNNNRQINETETRPTKMKMYKTQSKYESLLVKEASQHITIIL